MAARLTTRQSEIAAYVAECERRNLPSPTIREIANRFGIRSYNGVRCHLQALEKKGLILRDPFRARSIRLVAKPDSLPMPEVRSLDGQIALDFGPAGRLSLDHQQAVRLARQLLQAAYADQWREAK